MLHVACCAQSPDAPYRNTQHATRNTVGGLPSDICRSPQNKTGGIRPGCRLLLSVENYFPTGTLTFTLAVPPPARTPSFAATVEENVLTIIFTYRFNVV